MSAQHTEEIAATAARLVVEEGLEYGPAKRRAARDLGLPPRTALPSNDQLLAQVQDYIALFCPDTQPSELLALRQHAAVWMARLAEFRPHLAGAVWNGTATRLSDIYLQLFCQDPKSAELALIDKGVRFDVSRVPGFQGDTVDALSIHSLCPGLDEHIGVHLLIHDLDDQRGACLPDRQGRKPRGDLGALEQLLLDNRADERKSQ